jgi:DhnA family fructose-bisphosphate aldolase class Ia
MKFGINSALGAGKLRRLRRFIRDDDRSVLVAIDHAAYLGTGPSAQAIEAIAAGKPDGVLATWHGARAHAELFVDAGLVLRVDGGISELGEASSDDLSDLLYGAEHAIAIGADAVITLAFPGSPQEDRSLRRLARLCAECETLGIPVIAEVIPGGWARTVEWSPDAIARGARIAVELGADVIKSVCPERVEEFSVVVESCPAPVVALGGPRMAVDDDVVDFARAVIQAGAAGIAFGRNVWGSSDPRGLVERLHEVVHGRST